jgi:hypothetical protein
VRHQVWVDLEFGGVSCGQRVRGKVDGKRAGAGEVSRFGMNDLVPVRPNRNRPLDRVRVALSDRCHALFSFLRRPDRLEAEYRIFRLA